MSVRTSPWAAGMPCLIDIGLPDMAAATSFYADVLGWTYRAAGDGVLAQVHDVAAASLRPQPAGTPAWNLYLASDDADATPRPSPSTGDRS